MDPTLNKVSNDNPSARVKLPLKYKPRSASAHRDFPPGCGRNSRPITNLMFEETLPTDKTAVPNNSVATEIPVNAVQKNGTGACDKEGKSSSKEISSNCQLEIGIEAHDSIVEVIPRIGNNPLDKDILDSLVENATGVCDKEGKSSSKEISANCQLENDIEAIDSKVEAIPRTRNSPLEIDSLVEKVVTSAGMFPEDNVAPEVDHQAIVSLSVEGNASLTPNVPCEDVIPQTSTKQTFAMEEKNVQEIGSVANEVVQSHNLEAYVSPKKSVNNNDNNQKETIPTVKYKRRTKSAHRDFPPFCGRNAPCPSEKDLWEIEVRNDDVKEPTELKVEVKRNWEEINEDVLVGNKEGSSNYSITIASSVEDTTEYNHEEEDKEIVHALMATPNCPWRNPTLGSANKVSVGAGSSARMSKKKKLTSEKVAFQCEGELEGHQEPSSKKSLPPFSSNVSKMAPPFSLNVSNHGDARSKVRETLRLFQASCRKLLQEEEARLKRLQEEEAKRKLLQEEEAKSKLLQEEEAEPNLLQEEEAEPKLLQEEEAEPKLLQEEEAKPEKMKNTKRVDLMAADIIKDKKKEANKDFHDVGPVPGVEIGDEFQYRVELALVGVHRLYQAGIDYMKKGGKIIATSVVASGGYADCLDNPDVLVYSGQGGLTPGKKKDPADQKLERGNLALFNSISEKNAVRVIHGTKETTKSSNSEVKTKLTTTYTYDGLYLVEKYWQEMGSHGKLVYKFELKRIPGQPTVAWKEVKQIRKFKVRKGLCNDDISLGKEPFPICAVNTVDDEKPPSFTYITKMHYLNPYHPVPQKGCDCIGGCADYGKCSCVMKNGGEIPFNYNGAIVETKSLVYECGPYCKCPSSCPNRVSQHGMKIQLEIFKTPTRGWGVRSLTSISSGSFICEYMGELIEDKEAEKRQNNDEYLFDIGQNYTHSFQIEEMDNNKKLLDVSEVGEDDGYTIDAAKFGNVGRFINHSCSPNLYAQNVLYDHEDKRMPHIMLFAAENIPPLKELTYHYNYTMDSVYDSSGNIKKKNCYCGSVECTGRMY